MGQQRRRRPSAAAPATAPAREVDRQTARAPSRGVLQRSRMPWSARSFSVSVIRPPLPRVHVRLTPEHEKRPRQQPTTVSAGPGPMKPATSPAEATGADRQKRPEQREPRRRTTCPARPDRSRQDGSPPRSHRPGSAPAEPSISAPPIRASSGIDGSRWPARDTRGHCAMKIRKARRHQRGKRAASRSPLASLSPQHPPGAPVASTMSSRRPSLASLPCRASQPSSRARCPRPPPDPRSRRSPRRGRPAPAGRAAPFGTPRERR